MLEKNTNSKTILQVPLTGKIKDAFDVGFLNSGFESRTEYVRYLIKKDFDSVTDHIGFGEVQLKDSDIKD